jgi:hypothetical protein
MQEQPTMADIIGTVNTKAKVRSGPKLTDPEVQPRLEVGTKVPITGFAIDPDGGENKHRYRIVRNGKEEWTTARLLNVAAVDVDRIPFIPTNPERAAEELLEAAGIDIEDGTQLDIEEARQMAARLRICEIKGTFNAISLKTVREILDKIANYGLTISTEDGGCWTLTELKYLIEACDGMARGMGEAFKEVFGLDDPVLAFRMMYAPLVVVRSGKSNVSLVPGEIWWALNSKGYRLVLGSHVFFEGRVKSRRWTGMTFTSPELIAHEISHTLNWRYRLLLEDGKTTEEPDVYYEKFCQTAKITLPDGKSYQLARDDGYGFAARSSNGHWETVTDALANYLFGTLTDSDPDPKRAAMGKARREQLGKLLKMMIRWHVQEFRSVNETYKAAIQKAFTGQGNILSLMDHALDLLTGDGSFEKAASELKTKFKAG